MEAWICLEEMMAVMDTKPRTCSHNLHIGISIMIITKHLFRDDFLLNCIDVVFFLMPPLVHEKTALECLTYSKACSSFFLH